MKLHSQKSLQPSAVSVAQGFPLHFAPCAHWIGGTSVHCQIDPALDPEQVQGSAELPLKQVHDEPSAPAQLVPHLGGFGGQEEQTVLHWNEPVSPQKQLVSQPPGPPVPHELPGWQLAPWEQLPPQEVSH